MSGEVYAAAKASTCCGRKARMGLPTKSPQAILWGPRKEGEQYSNVRDVHPVLTSEPAALSERVLHEFAYNSETNGDGVKMFNLGRVRPS